MTQSNQYVDLSLAQGASENLYTLLKIKVWADATPKNTTQIGVLEPFYLLKEALCFHCFNLARTQEGREAAAHDLRKMTMLVKFRCDER